MVAVVSPERMPRGVHSRKVESYDTPRPVSGARSGARLTVVRRPVPLPAGTYRRRQAVAAGLVVAVVLALSAALGALGGGPLPVPERPAPSASLGDGPVYIVQSGDTFWSIARRLEPTGDPRPVVDRLVASHGGSTLHVGERIPLPVS